MVLFLFNPWFHKLLSLSRTICTAVSRNFVQRLSKQKGVMGSVCLPLLDQSSLFQRHRTRMREPSNFDHATAKCHFRVAFCLCVKTSLRVKLFINDVFCLEVHFHANQTHLHMKGFARRLVLKQRHKVPPEEKDGGCTFYHNTLRT